MSRKPSMMSNGRTPWKDPAGSLICKDPDLSLGHNENSKFKREFITILIPLSQAAVQACGGWHVCLGTFLLWPKLLCQLWAPFSPILCALWGESKSLECLFQQSEAENIPAAFDIILPHDAGRYKLDQAQAGGRARACKRVGVGHFACGYPRAALQSAFRPARRSVVRMGRAAAAAAVEIYIHHPQGWSLCLHLTLHQRKMESFCRNAIFGEFYLRSVKSFTASRKLF